MGTTTIQSIVLIAVFGASVANADSFRPSYEDERVPPKKVSSDQAAVGNNIKNTQEKMRRAYEGQRAFQTVSGENIGTSIGNLKPGEEPLGGVYEDCDMKCIYEREIELLSLQALFSRYKVESVSTAISGLEDLSDPSDSNQKQLDYLAQELSPQY